MLDAKIQKELIDKGRAFMRGYLDSDPYEDVFESDQELKLPQPPLTKDPMRGEEDWVVLPRNFEDLEMKNSLTDIFRDRQSNRVYTGEGVSLLQLSYLLWATQGIKQLRGKRYATLRTVPCGGARHEFETYMVVRNVEGLRNGAYHYLPFQHAVEFLHPVDDAAAKITESVSGQSWAGKADVVFYWSMEAYRAEWRYGIYAHRVALIDLGHVGENMYLACTGLGIGTCGIAAFSHERCCELFGLDGVDEYPVYVMPVGSIRESDKQQEQAFYSFVDEEGL